MESEILFSESVLSTTEEPQNPETEVLSTTEEPQNVSDSNQSNEGSPNPIPASIPDPTLSTISVIPIVENEVDGDSDGDKNELIVPEGGELVYLDTHFKCFLTAYQQKRFESFSDYYSALVLSLSVEKSVNIQHGYRLKASIVHLIQAAIVNVFSTFYIDSKVDKKTLGFFIKGFTEEYFELITTNFKSIFKESKIFFENYFADNDRNLSHAHLQQLFLSSISITNNKCNGRSDPALDENTCRQVFDDLYTTTIHDTNYRGYGQFIYSMIERAIEQRSIIVAYTILYLYNVLMSIARATWEPFVFSHKIEKSPFLSSILSGTLILKSQPVIEYLFDTKIKFEKYFPVECALIIHATQISNQLNGATGSYVDPKKFLSKTLSIGDQPQSVSKESVAPSSSSSSFFGLFG
jgi:hypothetical protein